MSFLKRKKINVLLFAFFFFENLGFKYHLDIGVLVGIISRSIGMIKSNDAVTLRKRVTQWVFFTIGDALEYRLCSYLGNIQKNFLSFSLLPICK